MIVLIGRRYEANTFDANDACFTYPITSEPGRNFAVRYSITSDEIVVYMNLRSIVSNNILQKRLLPSRFDSLHENCRNLTEPYEIEFCATSEIIADNTDISTPASATIFQLYYVYFDPDSGWYLLFYALYLLGRNAASGDCLYLFQIHTE